MTFNDYLQSYSNYFWQWEENGEVIAIPEGSTIGYFKTVVSILESFENKSLPRFGSALLVLVAMNETMGDDLNQIEALISSNLDSNTVHDQRSDVLDNAMLFLRVIQSLPNNYKSGINRALVFQHIFEDAHNNVGLKYSESILNQFKSAQATKKINLIKKPLPQGLYLRDFRVLSLLYKRFLDAQTIIDGISNLPNLISSLKVKLEDEEPSKVEESFVDQLIQHQSTFQIGALIKRIWSGLRIPYHLSLPSGQPLGGVSDLTNKGDFDRLLISEFANDDLLFLSRLANNEALYIRREEPPGSDDFQRVLIIDVSIKNWGTPRTLAYAVAVAIANHPKTDIHCVGFAVGNEVHQLQLGTVDEVVESLNHLDHCLHPALGLEDFLKHHAESKNSEIFFISSEETIQFKEMQRILNEYHALFKYWVNVDNQGNIKLFKNQYKTKRLIQEIHLPLEELWSTKKPIKSIDEDIIAQHNYPILFPLPTNKIKVLPVNEQVKFVITMDRRLCRISERNKGMELIEEFPFVNKGCRFEIGHFDNGEIVILCFIPNSNQIKFYNLYTKSFHKLSFRVSRSPSYPEFFFYQNDFYYSNAFQYWKISYSSEPKVVQNPGFSAELKDAYEQRRMEIQKLSGYISAPSVLRNVKRIYINENGNLVINIHELFLYQDASLILVNSQFKKVAISSNHDKRNNKFIFDDGSTITIDASGLMILKSSDTNKKDIFVPLTLQESLGACTEDHFAGNAFYLPQDGPEKLNMRPFYHEYIEGFISHIKNYAAKN